MSVAIETQPKFRVGAPTLMFELPPVYSSGLAQLRRQWDRAPDGNAFSFSLREPAQAANSGKPRIVFVVNWLEELRRLARTK